MKKRQRKAAPRAEGKPAKSTRRMAKSERTAAAKKPAKLVRTSFGSATKSFIGHLEGTSKSTHTIDAYRFDLNDFATFLQGQRGSSPRTIPDPRSLSRKDLERYHDWLRTQGQKANTRRRKLMTVRKFMHYLTARKKIDLDIGRRLPAPEKSERVPETIDLSQLVVALEKQPRSTPLGIRNFALLSVLIDTGAGVSEVAKLRWSMVDLAAGTIRFVGKAERDLKLRPATVSALTQLQQAAGDADSELCFVGYNRYGPIRIGKRPLGITSRGIELLVKSLAGELGFGGVTPRVLRHSAVVEWYLNGADESEIQRRLGLKTAYSFRIYAPLFAKIDAKAKSRSGATSTA